VTVRASRLGVVIRREYLSRVRTRAFWIATIAVPLLILAVTLLPSLLIERMGGDYEVAVVTQDRGLFDDLARELAARSGQGASGSSAIVVLHPRHVLPATPRGEQRVALKRDVVAKRLAGVLILPPDVLAGGSPEYLSTNVSNFRLLGILERALARAVVQRRLANTGVPADRLGELTKTVELLPVRLGDNGAESRDEAAVKSFALSYILTLTIFMTVMFYGYYVMRGVLEEKTSRIVEVVVANLSPFELMAGKILGIGAVGLTQYAIWVLLATNLAAGLLPARLAEGGSVAVPPALLVFFVIFFVVGYFQFATLYAAVGAAFSTEEEAQQMQSLVGIVMSMSAVLMVPVMANPDSPVSVMLSMVPFWAPVLFFMRMTVQFPPAWQIAVCLAIQLLATILMARLAAAVYRVGILMVGKKPTLAEIWRWARA
jgi:ABC-2 type transport system permease protein